MGDFTLQTAKLPEGILIYRDDQGKQIRPWHSWATLQWIGIKGWPWKRNQFTSGGPYRGYIQISGGNKTWFQDPLVDHHLLIRIAISVVNPLFQDTSYRFQ